jgi:hypothetical protein
MTADGARWPNFALLVGLVWLAVTADLLLTHWAGTAVAVSPLSDTDDALRLVEVRDFLHGQGWFDMHQARLDPPGGYDSHWSRLIDAGLAGLFILFHQFVDTALAERLMRAVWPLLWILPAILAVAATTWRIAGREAAMVTLLLCAVGLPAYQQFVPGRIDHHDVQITLALACVAATVWSDRVRGAAVAAGALSGLALAIGLENLVFVALCGVAFVLRYAATRDGAAPLARYGWTLAAGAAAAFLVNVGPDHWGRAVCDTMAINWAAPAVAAGLLMGLAGHLAASERPAVRLAVAGAIAAVAGALFVAIEPRCLAGPYAMMDPQLRAIWFSRVSEMQPFTALLRNKPAVAAAVIVYPAAAMAAMLVLARDPALRRDFAFRLAACELALGFALMLSVAKMCMYAIWLGMPLITVLALQLAARLRLQTRVARIVLALLLTPTVLSASAIAAVEAAGAPPIEERDTRVLGGCFKSANYAQLARLPTGLMATEVDLGAFVLALTPHSVIGAPYHRLTDGIIAAHQMLAFPPDQAHVVLRRTGANYLVICGKRPPPGLDEAERRASLWGRLEAGAVPRWLAPVPAQPGEVFRVYRISRN